MRYRLKKKYPTLPPDWEESMEVHIKGKNPYYSTVDNRYRQHYLYIYDVENNPEYWEKVVEKSYEIMSVATQTFVGTSFSKIDIEDFESGKSKSFVNSVKRLSDNVVFTIGDNTKEGVILDFDFPGSDKSQCRYKVELEFLGDNWRMLSEAKKIFKVELGRTVDTSEPIYENDKVFLLTCNWTCPEVTMTKKEYFKIPPILFKSKEAAEQHIFMNKPCLSYAEVLDGLKKSGVISVGSIEIIVRNKLKLDNGS